MAYIIAVNVCFPILKLNFKANRKASILTQSGGTCVCTNAVDPTCERDAAYNTCLVGQSWFILGSTRDRLMIPGIKRDLTTATAAITGISTIAFGFLTNLPVALA
jgi:AGZA family xanthine/uracil permease-like MFS transporter